MELETLKAYIENNLTNGFIKPSQSPAGSSLLFDKKPDGRLRVYLDYRGLNNLTIKNWYPLPLVRKSLDQQDWAQYFTQLDLTNPYHWMRIKEGNKWKTTFRTRYNHFKYQIILFGLTNALAMFQDNINKILAEKFDVFVIVYLDNILIYIESKDK